MLVIYGNIWLRLEEITVKTKYFQSFHEIQEALEIGLEMQFYLFNKKYYFGAPQGKYLLSTDNGDWKVIFDDLEGFYDYKINGRKICDLWMEIDLITM